MSKPSNIVIIWSSGDPDVAHKLVFMYAFNAKNFEWWERVRLVIWGPSAKLTSEDAEIQQQIKKMIDGGVEMMACKSCADMYGVADKLEDLGINVAYMGQPLTEMLKSGWVSLTF